jgi:hypothetical protein
MTKWAEAANPFFAGVNADALSIVPYLLLIVLLYWIGREKAGK